MIRDIRRYTFLSHCDDDDGNHAITVGGGGLFMRDLGDA